MYSQFMVHGQKNIKLLLSVCQNPAAHQTVPVFDKSFTLTLFLFISVEIKKLRICADSHGHDIKPHVATHLVQNLKEHMYIVWLSFKISFLPYEMQVDSTMS